MDFPIYEVHGHRIVMAPTSCRCGGDWAWLRVLPSGMEQMLGCICHTQVMEAIHELDIISPPRDSNFRTWMRGRTFEVGVRIRAPREIFFPDLELGKEYPLLDDTWMVVKMNDYYYDLEKTP